MQDEPPQDPSAVAETIGALDERIRQLQAEIHEQQASSLGMLVAVVERALEDPDADHVGARAAKLLGEIADPRAIDVLLRALEHCDPVDELPNAAMFALIAIGAPVLEPALARLDAAEPDDEARYGYFEILSQLRIADERIFDHLVRAESLDATFVAARFADFGDRRGLPHVHRLFDALRLTGDLNHDRDVLDMADAIERLGGVLSEAQRRKLSAYEDARDGPRMRRKLGRNEPCWCGSGKKYKRCHEAADRDAD